MNIIVIPGANMNLAETQDEYQTLPVKAGPVTVTFGEDDEVTEVPALRSAWVPTREELALLLDGGYVELCILGVTHPTVMLNVEPHASKVPANDG